MLTITQKTTVKNDIAANSDLNILPNDEPGNYAIASLYNAEASPAFWVWKSAVTEEEIVGQPSVDNTLFSWSAYIGRGQGERDGWMRLFRSGKVNPSMPNVQAAVLDIFSGVGTVAVAQRTHIQATFRRKATRLEKLLSTGTGSAGSPATMGFEGKIDLQDVADARA